MAWFNRKDQPAPAPESNRRLTIASRSTVCLYCGIPLDEGEGVPSAVERGKKGHPGCVRQYENPE